MFSIGTSMYQYLEYVKTGKYQKHNYSWMLVKHRFYKGINLHEYRTKDQVYLKQGKMNKEVMLFSNLYNNMKRQWRSGKSDVVILQKALKVYEQENEKPFKFVEVRNLVKNNKKWKLNKTSDNHIESGSKWSRTS